MFIAFIMRVKTKPYLDSKEGLICCGKKQKINFGRNSRRETVMLVRASEFVCEALHQMRSQIDEQDKLFRSTAKIFNLIRRTSTFASAVIYVRRIMSFMPIYLLLTFKILFSCYWNYVRLPLFKRWFRTFAWNYLTYVSIIIIALTLLYFVLALGWEIKVSAKKQTLNHVVQAERL